MPRRSRNSCQAKSPVRVASPVRRGARKMAEPQVGVLAAFWKGKTMRTADAILWGVVSVVTGVHEGSGGLQEESTKIVDISPAAALKRGEVLLVRPGEEEYDERHAADGTTDARLVLDSQPSTRETHLIQNTHRQLAYCVSTPPRTGPNTPAEANTVPTTAEIYFLA